MSRSLDPKQLRRLDIQGFDSVAEERLAAVAPWLRMAFALCAASAIVATALASVPLFLVLAVIAGAAALSPVHPFDLLYNHGIRRFTGTDPLPHRGAPSRFACGIGAVGLLVTAWAFSAGMLTLGYILGFTLSAVASLVGTVDICIPSRIYRAIFGAPRARANRSPVQSPEVSRPPSGA